MSEWLESVNWGELEVTPMPTNDPGLEPVEPSPGYRHLLVDVLYLDFHPGLSEEYMRREFAKEIQHQAEDRGVRHVFVGEPETEDVELDNVRGITRFRRGCLQVAYDEGDK